MLYVYIKLSKTKTNIFREFALAYVARLLPAASVGGVRTSG